MAVVSEKLICEKKKVPTSDHLGCFTGKSTHLKTILISEAPDSYKINLWNALNLQKIERSVGF